MPASRQLDYSNPDHIEYSQGPIAITVLGGVRLEGLDRMRVTLKIQVEHLALRHNLDLYNDNQVEKLVRKVAEKLEVGTSVTTAALNDLTGLLEEYRLAEREKQDQQYERRKILSEKERKEAEAFLSASDLMERTGAMIGHSGVVGEELNRLLMYVIYTSRKREQPLHIISLGASGTGKTHLQETVGALIPDEDKLEITTLSENAFYYFGQRELSHKLILIEDLDGAEGVLYPLRELQTKKKISKTVVQKNTKGETRTLHLRVEGPVSVAGCTTRERIYEDNANRSFLIYLDESPEQDQRIMRYQRLRSAGKVNEKQEAEAARLLANCQRILQPITVRNPYAEQLAIPSGVFKPRRTNGHYLAFIEAVTFYHQYQREQQTDKQSGEIYIETTPEDIAEANKLMKEVLLRKSDTLSGACRGYFERLKLHLNEAKETSFTNRQISLNLRIPLATVKRHHLQLFNTGRIQLHGKKQGKAFTYKLVDPSEYEKLREQISTVLDATLERLSRSKRDRLSGSTSAQRKTEPVKRKKAS